MVARPQVRTVGLVLHPTESVDRSVEMIIASGRDDNVRVLAREIDRHRVPAGVDVVADAQFLTEVDGVIAMGGDGTMLGAMRLVIDRPVPVLGVNYGNLGFLVEVTPADLSSALARLAAGDFSIEHHGCLDIDADGVELTTRFGFNDVVLGRLNRAGTVSVDLGINNLQFGYYRGDAVVISTPNGSTAYNYAAGGPIVSPSANAFIVTPVAPMSGIKTPIVLGGEERVSLHVAAESGPIAVDIDGIPAGELARSDRLIATMRREAAQVVRFSTEDHASQRWVKLGLRDLPLRADQMLDLIPPEVRRNVDAAVDHEDATDRRP